MKKFLVSFLLAVVLAFSVNAGGLTSITFGAGPMTWTAIDTATNVYTPGGKDSVVGVDTSWLFSKVAFTPGCVYAVTTFDSVGATDTVTIQYTAYITGKTGTKTVSSGTADTILPSAGTGTFSQTTYFTVLGNTTLCNKFDVKMVGWISAKIAKMRSATLWRGRYTNGTYGVDYLR